MAIRPITQADIEFDAAIQQLAKLSSADMRRRMFPEMLTDSKLPGKAPEVAYTTTLNLSAVLSRKSKAG